MKRSKLILIMLILPIIPFAITSQVVTPVDAWGLTTHQFIVSTARDAISNSSWLEVFEYYTPELLAGSTTPDQVFQDWPNHLYYPETGEHTAPEAAKRWYDFARINFSCGNWEAGFFATGVMSHYFTDPHIPVHTGSNWPGHSAYETEINANLGGLTLTTPTEDYIANVSQAVIDAATYSHQYYDTVVAAYPNEDSEAFDDAAIVTLTENCLSLAIDNTLDLFYNLTEGFTPPDVSYTYKYVALFDAAHANDYIDVDELQSVEATLGRNHFEMQEQTTAFSAGDLDDVDLLVITCGLTEYSSSELTVISDWADTGNKSILLTSRGDYSTVEDTARPNQVLEAIGSDIRINDDDVHMLGTYATHYNDLYDIPGPTETIGLTMSVSSFTMYSPSSLYFLDEGPVLPIIWGDESTWQRDRESPDIEVIYDNTDDGKNGEQIPLVAVEEIGELRVLVAGTTFFSDFDYGKSAIFSNVILFENFLDWTCGNRSSDNVPDEDEMGPKIGNIEVTPANPEDDVTVTVTATITDPSGVDIVLLNYSTNEGVVQIEMVAAGNVFSVEVPGVVNASRDCWFIANDTEGNIAIRGVYTIAWGEETDTTPTVFVIDTVTLIIIGVVAIIAILAIILILKRK
ncbi:MAG: zinc dependent phospholipase C family protein [Candidatus Thorarchaeota archaeon]